MVDQSLDRTSRARACPDLMPRDTFTQLQAVVDPLGKPMNLSLFEQFGMCPAGPAEQAFGLVLCGAHLLLHAGHTRGDPRGFPCHSGLSRAWYSAAMNRRIGSREAGRAAIFFAHSLGLFCWWRGTRLVAEGRPLAEYWVAEPAVCRNGLNLLEEFFPLTEWEQNELHELEGAYGTIDLSPFGVSGPESAGNFESEGDALEHAEAMFRSADNRLVCGTYSYAITSILGTARVEGMRAPMYIRARASSYRDLVAQFGMQAFFNSHGARWVNVCGDEPMSTWEWAQSRSRV